MATSTQALEDFVKAALAQQQPRDSIARVASAAGWPEDQIRSVMSGFAEVEFVVPVPRPRPHLSAREAFLYLLLFSALYFSAFHLGSVCFDMIERLIPDPAMETGYRNPETSLRWSVAYLVVVFPLFVWLSAYTHAEVKRNPIKRLSPARRWLTYLTLYVAAATVVTDLIVLIYYVLAGELTLRFIFKVLVVLVIAGTAIGYYLSDLRKEERT